MIWKISLPPAGAIACRRGGAVRMKFRMVRYTNCSPCAVALKQQYPAATIEELELEPANPRLVQRRCEHDPGTIDELARLQKRAQEAPTLAGAAV